MKKVWDKVFYKVVLLFLVGVVRYAEIANKIVEFLTEKYLIKDLMDDLDFSYR